MAAPAIAAAVTSAVRAAPGVAQKALTFVSKATNGRVNSVGDVLKYAQKGNAQAAVVAEGMVRAGAPVKDVLPVDAINASRDREMQALVRAMFDLTAQQGKKIDAQHGGLGDSPADDILRMSLCKVAERRFGSIAAFRQVQMAIETLTERDLALYEAMKKA